MRYKKPNLLGYSAVLSIQDQGGTNLKIDTPNEMVQTALPSDPAYQADE
jgi:hypothetical protein